MSTHGRAAPRRSIRGGRRAEIAPTRAPSSTPAPTSSSTSTPDPETPSPAITDEEFVIADSLRPDYSRNDDMSDPNWDCVGVEREMDVAELQNWFTLLKIRLDDKQESLRLLDREERKREAGLRPRKANDGGSGHDLDGDADDESVGPVPQKRMSKKATREGQEYLDPRAAWQREKREKNAKAKANQPPPDRSKSAFATWFKPKPKGNGEKESPMEVDSDSDSHARSHPRSPTASTSARPAKDASSALRSASSAAQPRSRARAPSPPDPPQSHAAGKRRASERDDQTAERAHRLKRRRGEVEDIVEPPAVDANDDGTVAEDLDDPDYKPVDTDVEDGWEDDADEIAMPPPSTKDDWDALLLKAKEEGKKKNLTSAQRLQLDLIREFCLRMYRALDRKEKPSRAAIAKVVTSGHVKGTGARFQRRVCSIVRHFHTFGRLPKEARGGAHLSGSLLYNELVRTKVLQYLSSCRKDGVRPATLTKHVNNVILPELAIDTTICVRTARRWLVLLGWRYSRCAKGIYFDGHERWDVVLYRVVYIARMLQYKKRMTVYEGDALLPKPPTLVDGEKEIIPLYHDESAFFTNDYKSKVWLKDGEQKLRSKGRGRMIHVSDFINPECGRLTHTDADGKPLEARVITYPAKDGDPYWDSAQLLNQVTEALRIFALKYPNKVGLWVFDNATAHCTMPENALIANTTNLKDGGKQNVKRDTVIPVNCPRRGGEKQSMSNEDGTPKGARSILTERGYDLSGMVYRCRPGCDKSPKGDDPSTACCMLRLLGLQQDYKDEKSKVEILIEKAGHLCIFLPKFHCELNPIEMYWGWSKFRYRDDDKDTFEEAKVSAKKWLDECPLPVIRRFINRTWRFIDAYERGLKPAAKEWAARPQKQHRNAAESAMVLLEQ